MFEIADVVLVLLPDATINAVDELISLLPERAPGAAISVEKLP